MLIWANLTKLEAFIDKYKYLTSVITQNFQRAFFHDHDYSNTAESIPFKFSILISKIHTKRSIKSQDSYFKLQWNIHIAVTFYL